MEFFNGLGKKFTNAARTVQEKTRDTVENSRLNSDLRDAAEELDRRYAELGRAYFESLSQSGAPVPEAEIEAVRDAVYRVEDLTAQRDKLNRQIRCPACGAVQAEDANYCSNCGKAMPEPAPEIAGDGEGVEYCVRCGAMRDDRTKFCAICGEAFDPADRIPELPVPAPKAAAADAPEEPDYAENEE